MHIIFCLELCIMGYWSPRLINLSLNCIICLNIIHDRFTMTSYITLLQWHCKYNPFTMILYQTLFLWYYTWPFCHDIMQDHYVTTFYMVLCHSIVPNLSYGIVHGSFAMALHRSLCHDIVHDRFIMILHMTFFPWHLTGPFCHDMIITANNHVSNNSKCFTNILIFWPQTSTTFESNVHSKRLMNV